MYNKFYFKQNIFEMVLHNEQVLVNITDKSTCIRRLSPFGPAIAGKLRSKQAGGAPLQMQGHAAMCFKKHYHPSL